jgi:hypothetical protein
LSFIEALDQSWTLVTTTSGVVGFDAGNFLIRNGAYNGTDGFVNLFTRTVAVSVAGNDLVLNDTAVPEPTTWTLLGAALLMMAGWARGNSQKVRRGSE